MWLKCDKFIFHVGRKTAGFEALSSWKLWCRRELIAKTDRQDKKRISVCLYIIIAPTATEGTQIAEFLTMAPS